MKAVYTLHLQNGKHYGKNYCGFSTEIDLARFLTLSVLYAKKQFPVIELFCDRQAQEFAQHWQIPFEKITILETPANLDSAFWAYPKIQTYAAQKKPFIHIDCDVILWEKIPEQKLKAPLLFQNREEFDSHQGYRFCIDYFRKFFPNREIAERLQFPEYANNCGIVAANNLEMIKQWKESVDGFLLSPGAKDFWNPETLKHGWNHFFEQLFAAAIAEHMNLKPEYLITGFIYENIPAPTFKITHLWGTSKQRPDLMERIAARLENEYPEQSQLINDAATDHKQAFTEVYKNNVWGKGSGGGSSQKQTTGYRSFLEKFILDKKIKTIVDLGCGDFEMMKLVNIGKAEYLGIDCVESILNQAREKYESESIHFLIGDMTRSEIPKCDLLLIKDVFIHWTNAQVKKFLSRNIPAKFILVTNDDRVSSANKDIEKPGKFREIDITKPPFNSSAQVVLKWKEAHKSTWLIIPGPARLDSTIRTGKPKQTDNGKKTQNKKETDRNKSRSAPKTKKANSSRK